MHSNQSLLIAYNETTLAHQSSKTHPECPQRVIAIHQTIQNLLKSSSLSKKITYAELTRKSEEDDEVVKRIEKVHGQSYSEFVEGMWYEGIKKPEMFINIDTYFMKDTYMAAKEAVRTCVYTVDSLLSSKHEYGFGIVRPPGHHSGMKSQPHGFSFFNNLAIAVDYATSVGKKRKVAIIDWDVHHGQGTQKLFYKRKDVLFISLHRFDNAKFFPHLKQSGSEFIGEAQGEGYNINICWNLPEKPKNAFYEREESCGDEQYVSAFQSIVLPILREYEPEMIFVSCGFDSAQGDQIGKLKLTHSGYTYMTQKLMNFGKPIFMILEGGYNLDVLKWGSETVIRALTKEVEEKERKQLQKLQKVETNKIGLEGIQICKQKVKKYWKSIE